MPVSPDRNLEREVKLVVDDGFTAPNLTGAFDGLVVRSAGEAAHVDSYYDTADLRLVRSGITLRSREEEGDTTWTVKLPMPDADAADGMSRLEVNVDAPPGRVPPESSRLVRAHVRTGSLRLVARFATMRRTTSLARDGHAVGVVDDDEVSIEAGIGKGQRFREVEVEIDPDAPTELLSAVVDAFVDSGAKVADPRPKLAQALGARAAQPPELAPLVLDDTPTLEQAVRAALTDHVRRIVEHDPVIRLDLDSEGVHQMRVATRRLRADLRTFRPMLDREWSEPLRDEAKWLGRALGAVRDADVMLASMRERRDELPRRDQAGADRLIARLESEREAAQATMQNILDGRRYRLLLEALVDAAGSPRFAADVDPHHDAAAIVPTLAAKPWKKLRKEVSGLGDEPANEALHQVRIRAKRARYASEAAALAVGQQAEQLADRLSDLQDVLGELQDAVVAEDWLRRAAGDSGADTDEALVAGLLIARERAEAADRRDGWESVWDRARKKKRTAWLKT